MTETYDGGTRWGIVQRLNARRDVIPMDEATARKFYKSWTKFAKTIAAPDEPDRWPQLVSAHLTWQVVEDQ